jgi:hypothetical protein
MRLREGRLVNAAFVGADAAKGVEVRKDAGAIDVEAFVGHERRIPVIEVRV